MWKDIFKIKILLNGGSGYNGVVITLKICLGLDLFVFYLGQNSLQITVGVRIGSVAENLCNAQDLKLSRFYLLPISIYPILAKDTRA